ncbi:hypothetical protein [Brevundimonas sp.]|uniref:hypothetical protein n=1 Tax=Brevundimonas sp. TaxID=1871086 RepID=UPI0035B3987A
MRTPKVTLPKEDPAVTAARQREEARVEAARTEETQALLTGATVRRLRRFGRVSSGSGGSVPIYRPPSTGGSSGGGMPTSGGSVSSGGSFGGSGNAGRDLAVLY